MNFTNNEKSVLCQDFKIGCHGKVCERDKMSKVIFMYIGHVGQ